MTAQARVQARKAFLTYQHTEKIPNFNLQEFYHFLLEIPNVTTVTVGQEKYPNEEGYHCHCQLLFCKKVTYKLHKFTYEGIVPYNEQYRSNAKGEVVRVHKYCIKDGLFFTNYTEDSIAGKDSGWTEIMQSNTREEALEIFNRTSPRDAILSRRQFDYWADCNFKILAEPYVPRPYMYTVPDTLSHWVATELYPGKLSIF